MILSFHQLHNLETFATSLLRVQIQEDEVVQFESFRNSLPILIKRESQLYYKRTMDFEAFFQTSERNLTLN